jgi:hypothetical protein
VALGAQLAPLPNGRPLGASMLVTAEAGRGKNHLMDAAVEPLPPEFYLAFEIASGQSLYYAADDNPEFLKHKFVYPNEIEGVDALVDFLRPMLSKGSARKFVTNKDSKGRNVLQEIVVEGPVTAAIPTVRNKTDEQLQTRLLVAELPDYVGRVKEHSRAVSELLHPDYTSADHSGRLFLWREGFRQLTARRRVVFPLDHPGFALDDDQISHGARLWTNLLGIMSAHAWLEQRNRRVIELPSGEEAIVAEPDDYEVAYKIFNAVCQRTVVNLSDTHRKILAAIHDLEYEFPNRDGFTQREIATGAGVSLGTVSNNKTFLVTSAKLMRESDAGLALPEGADPSWWSGGELSAGVPTPEQVRSWWDETTPPDGGGAEHAEHAEHAPDEGPKFDTPAEDGVQHPPEHPLNTSTSSGDTPERDKRVQSVFNEGVNGQNGTGKANNGHAEDVFSVFKGSGGNTGGKVVHVHGAHRHGAVYVGNAWGPRGVWPALPQTEFGNPYKIDLPDKPRDGDRETVIEKFRRDLERRVEADADYAARVRDLAGKTLACWCAEPRDAVLLPYDPLRCHAQMLLRIANRLAADVADDDVSPEDTDPRLVEWLGNPPERFVKDAAACVEGSPRGC